MAGALVGAGVGAITSLIGSGKEASAIKSAAQTQANAAEYAANLQKTAEDNSINFTKGVYGNAQGYSAPYQAAGTSALSTLSAGLQPGGEFNSTPTGDQVLQEDPGFAFRLQQGQLALERAEAAGGGVGSGGALKSATEFGQDYASSEYANAFNRFLTNRQANYSNLSNIAGEGLSADALITNAGTGAASNVANTLLAGAGAQGNYLTQGANATAAGAVGSTNIWANNLSNLGNLAQQYLANQNQSGYGNQLGAVRNLSNIGTVTPAQWAAYDAGSTPGPVVNAGSF